MGNCISRNENKDRVLQNIAVTSIMNGINLLKNEVVNQKSRNQIAQKQMYFLNQKKSDHFPKKIFDDEVISTCSSKMVQDIE